MRISLIGSHGTGKSTLGPLIVSALNVFDHERWDFVPEIAREVLEKEGVSENLGTLPVEKIIEVQEQILAEKKERRKGYSYFVEDRHPVIDVYAYSVYWLSRHPSATNFLNKIKEEVSYTDTSNDNLLIVVPPNIPLVKDGVRAEGEHFRNTVHYIVLGILEEFQIPYKVLETISLEERLKEALWLIKRSWQR